MSSVLRTSWQRGIINSQPYKGRIIDIDSKYLSDSDQDKVVPVLYGRDLLSTSMLFPPWNLRRKQNSSGGKGGGKGAGGGSDTFFASVLFAVCLGEVTRICRIYESDNLVYDTEEAGTAIGVGTKIETDYGLLRFYKGTPKQQIDPAIRSVLVFKSNESGTYLNYDVPDFRYICYAISDKWNLGSSTSHPNIRIEAFKECTKLKDDSRSNSNWMSGYDYAPPVILYEMLKDFPAITKMFTGNAEVQVDAESFATAANDCVSSGIYISVCIDNDLTLADAVANILEYCDGVVYVENNLLKIRLPWKEAKDRNYEPHIIFTKDDLIEEPEVSYQSDEWGITKVSFCDRHLDYEETTEVLEHPEYEGVVGLDAKIQEFERPFIKQRSVANTITKYLANVGVKPSVDLTINVLPESVSLVPIDNNTNRDLRVGDLIKVDYDETKYPGLGNVLFRVNSIAIAEDGAEIQAVSECKDFFEFSATDILYIEQEKYLSMGRNVPYLYPKILAQRELGQGETNGFQNQSGQTIKAFLFVAESYSAGRAKFIWTNIDSSGWAPDNADPDIGIEPSYQQSGILSDVFYYSASGQYRIKVSLSVDVMQSILDKNERNGESYYLVCCRYHVENDIKVASCVPIIFRVNSVSIATNELVCEPFQGEKFSDYSVAQGDSSSLVSSLFFLVSASELQNCSVTIKLQDRNRFAAVVYNTEGNKEKTPGYAGIFYKDKDSTVQDPPAVVNRENNETDLIFQHTVMWRDDECLPISNVQGESVEYPCLVWDPVKQNYYVQYRGVEPASDAKDYLPKLEIAESNKEEEAGQYYVYRENSDAFTHSSRHGFVHVHITDENAITLPVPDASTAENGDMITILVTRDAEVQQDHISLGNTENFYNPPEAGNTLKCATGEITKLICTQNKWLIIQTSKLT